MKTSKLLKGREITNGYVVIVFSFASDWLGGWREFSGPITKLILATIQNKGYNVISQ